MSKRLTATKLMIATLVRNSREWIGSTNELAIGAGVVAAGAIFYFLSRPSPERNL